MSLKFKCVLLCRDTVKMPLWMADFQVFAAVTANAWSPIVKRRVSIQPVPKSMMSAGVVDREVQRN